MQNNAKGKILFLDPRDRPAVSDRENFSAESVEYTAAEAFDRMIQALADAGYDPVTQMTTYLISDDPTFLPEEADVRALANHVGRDKLLEALLTFYLEHRDHEC